MNVSIIPATTAHLPHLGFADQAWVKLLIEDPETVSILAVLDTQIVGYGCTWLAPVHRKRRWLDLTVHPSYRLHGVGHALFHELSRGADRPFAARVVAGTSAARFAEALGGSVYQSCVRPELAGEHARRVAERWGTHAGVDVVSGDELPAEEVKRLFVQQYRWIHSEWSPLAESDLARTRLAAEAEQIDHRLTSIARDGELSLAGCFAFRDDPICLIAETIDGHHPEGRELVKAVIGHSVRGALAEGMTSVEFDGHTGDPNFGPVAEEMTLQGAQSILYEIPPADVDG